MKRTAFALALIILATPLLAVKGTPDGKRPMRIVVVHTGDGWADPNYDSSAAAIEQEIARQLRHAGLDAWEAHRTLDDIRADDRDEAELYVEVSGGNARLHEIGDIDISGPHVATTIGVIFSKTAAEIRLYDGRTYEQIDHFDLSRSKTTVVPTSFGVRQPFVGFTVAPLVRHLQYRSAIHDIAEEAVQRIAKR